MFGEIHERRPHGGGTGPGLLGWSALLVLATLLTPFAVWAVVRVAALLGA